MKTIYTADQLQSVYGLPQVAQPTQSEQPKKDFLQKTGDVVNAIFPGKQVGEAIGTAIATGVAGAKYGKEAALDVSATAPKPLQVVGDVAQGALSVGGLKVPVAGSVAGRIGQTASFGAGISGSGAVAEGKPLQEVATDTATGAVTGALLQGAFEGLPAVAKLFGNKATKLRESNLKLTPPQKEKLNSKIDDVVTFLKEKNITGNPESQYNKVSKYYDNAENVIQGAIKETGKTYTRQELVNNVMSIPEKYAGQFDNPEVYSQLENKSLKLADYIKKTFGSKYGDKIPAEKLNDLKRQYMKNGFNKAGDQISNEASLTIGDELYKTLLKDVEGLTRYNKEYSNIITTRKILGKALGRNELGAFGNLIALGSGATIGGAIGGPAGVVAGTVVSRPIAKVVAGTAAKTQYAKGLEKVSKTLAKTKGSKVPQVLNTVINQ